MNANVSQMPSYPYTRGPEHQKGANGKDNRTSTPYDADFSPLRQRKEKSVAAYAATAIQDAGGLS
jgi:hypothetical protein